MNASKTTLTLALTLAIGGAGIAHAALGAVIAAPAFDEQEVPPGPFAGPARYEPYPYAIAELFGRNGIPADSPQTPQSGVLRDAFFTRPNGATKPSERRDLRVRIVGYSQLGCQYDPQPMQELPPHVAKLMAPQRKVTMKAKTIWFWHRERPVLSDQGLEAIKRVNAYFDVDVAVTACPANYEQALATVFGGSDALKARIAGAPEEIKAYNKRQEARMQALREQPAPAKPANALPAVAFAQKATPLTDAELEESVSDAMVVLGENPQTLRDMLSAIAAIEANYDSMPGKRVIALVDERIMPTIDPLLAAAWANYPGRKVPRQRMDYAEWEVRFLRPVLQACGKLMAMGQTYSNAGAAAVGSQLGQAMLGRDVPSAGDWATMVYDNDKHCRTALDLAFRLYQTRFQAAAPLDPRYMATVHRQAKFEPPVEWRNADLPSSHIAPKATTTYFYGTAREVDAAMARHQFAENAARTAQSFADALAAREQGLQQKLHYMQDFWACYKARCAEGSKLYVQYLWILDQEDRQRFMPILQTANALMAPVNNFLSSRYTSGLDDVQWLITQLCEPARFGVLQEIRAPKNRSVTTEPLAWWQWLNNTESYAAWRDCRNKVAYAVKP